MALRPRVPPPRFGRLKQLECFSEVKRMVIEGYPAPEIARFIQEEKKEYTDVTRESLIRLIRSYRRSLSPGEVARNRMPTAFIEAWKVIQKQIPELKELLTLYEIQKDRIKIDYESEKKIKKLFATTGNEIKIAAQLLKQIVDTKFDLGLKERDLGKLSVDGELIPALQNAASKMDLPELEQVGLDPERRRRILETVDLLLRVSRGQADKKEDRSLLMEE